MAIPARAALLALLTDAGATALRAVVALSAMRTFFVFAMLTFTHLQGAQRQAERSGPGEVPTGGPGQGARDSGHWNTGGGRCLAPRDVGGTVCQSGLVRRAGSVHCGLPEGRPVQQARRLGQNHEIGGHTGVDLCVHTDGVCGARTLHGIADSPQGGVVNFGPQPVTTGFLGSNQVQRHIQCLAQEPEPAQALPFFTLRAVGEVCSSLDALGASPGRGRGRQGRGRSSFTHLPAWARGFIVPT